MILYAIGRIGVSGAIYRAMEFSGEAIDELPLGGRFTMAHMAVETGAKNGIFAVDEKTRQYVNGRAKREFQVFASDPGADYAEVLESNRRNWT